MVQAKIDTIWIIKFDNILNVAIIRAWNQYRQTDPINQKIT